MKNKITKFKTWFYEFQHGHPFLLNEEVEIICETRANKHTKWMNESEIQNLVKARVEAMYKEKYPNAKQYKFF